MTPELTNLIEAADAMKRIASLELQIEDEPCPDCRFDYGKGHTAGCLNTMLREHIEAFDAAKSNLIEAGKQSAPNHKTFEFDSTGLMEGAEERWSDYGYDNPKRAEERFGSSLVVWKTAWIESRAALVGQAIPQPTEARVAFTEEEIERYCIILHDAYESAAIKNGWQTQQRSRKPWPDVPDENKKTMRDAITVLMKKALANTHGRVVSVEDVMKAHTDCVEGNGVGDIQYVRYRNFRTRLTELFNTTKP